MGGYPHVEYSHDSKSGATGKRSELDSNHTRNVAPGNRLWVRAPPLPLEVIEFLSHKRVCYGRTSAKRGGSRHRESGARFVGKPRRGDRYAYRRADFFAPRFAAGVCGEGAGRDAEAGSSWADGSSRKRMIFCARRIRSPTRSPGCRLSTAKRIASTAESFVSRNITSILSKA